MAHPNATTRLKKVKSLMVDGMLSRKFLYELADEFGCSTGAIRADIISVRNDEIGGYHVSGKTRRDIYKKYDGICQYCFKKVTKPIVEHVIPASSGGKATYDNLVLSCQSCNIKKRFKDGSKLIY